MFCHLISNLTNTFFILVNNFSIMSGLFPVFSGLDQYIKADRSVADMSELTELFMKEFKKVLLES